MRPYLPGSLYDIRKKDVYMPRNITMDDIAAMAGVTKSTVSRYFNGGSVKIPGHRTLCNARHGGNIVHCYVSGHIHTLLPDII